MIQDYDKARNKPEPVPEHIRAKLLQRAGELPKYNESSPKFPKQNEFAFYQGEKRTSAAPEPTKQYSTHQLFPLMKKLGARHKVMQQMRNIDRNQQRSGGNQPGI
jgi:hypothetical protein